MVLAHDFNEGHRTQDVRISQDITFDAMLLTIGTLQGLNDSGFHRPSPIQLHGIPLGKCGFDLLLEAKSGTGKTAVFTVIALEKIDLNKGLQVVILAPTREIAMQIHDVIKQIGVRYEGLCVEVVMGGLPVSDDVEKFKKNVHIVVGSPGRLKHLIQDKYIVTTSVRLLILDEADKLMEKSFEADINYIHSVLPQQKQVIMSSATFPESSKSFIENYVQNAQHICPESTNILLGIEQRALQAMSNILQLSG
ncbi:PREDICTED: probable ATP-dependent RNA helicase DDX20 isoform X3 [Papilio polytes]|uniref:probable ATP-dependent RNA helicase DDX20 isoform X3 n=1 Tax=Papilio polytes TaxID=76194 RepID=UPI0006760CA2|nr:PREDICTED: probable ATP-dependent RNA helicase DDX20 isoform X3 [Papilio polytes]